MKIEAGKFYVTRDGRTVGPLKKIYGNEGVYPYGVTEGSADAWTENGNYWSHGLRDNEDLVAEATATPVPGGDVHAPHIVAIVINGKPAPATKPFVHAGYSAAREEALRLAGANPGSEFGIYQRVGGVVAEVVIKDAA